ncbi:MAG: alanine--tRNA ligase-related protein, partial [Candidatus Pacebacteria bacterium]|nr:alanine--tRNA ligase-related protein [Candidatus Paceibacterota bacterium]
CDCGRFIEISNNVFMQYIKMEDGSFKELESKNIDFGGGLERLTAITNNNADVFTIDIFQEIIQPLEQKSGKDYTAPQYQASFRIIADHIRAAEAMIAEGILPSNTDQGYFTRRLIRRSIIHGDMLGVPTGELSSNAEILAEEKRFRETLVRGMKEFEKIATVSVGGSGTTLLQPDKVFTLITTFGFPRELVEEMANERGLMVMWDRVDILLKEHRELSRAGAEQKFKGGLADSGEKTTAFHTATHLMLAGLRQELGEHVTQRGSNITAERVRFDFTHHEKVEREVLDKVEDFVNNAISAGAEVVVEEMDKGEARESGAVGAFWEKYPDIVTVYNIKSSDGTIYSRELCGGPHVESTDSLAKFGKFKIKKESSSSAGVRRIKAVFE